MKTTLVALLLGLCIVVGGCSFNSDQRYVEEKVPLRFYTFLNYEEFHEEIEKPVKQRFPDIEMQYVKKSTISASNLETDLQQADIWHKQTGTFTSPVGAVGFWDVDTTLGLEGFPAADLSGYITGQSHIIHIEPQLMNQAGWMSRAGELNYLPYTQRLYALFYQKQAFIENGLTPPIDGMTWLELIELSKTIPYGVKISFNPKSNFMSFTYQQSLPMGRTTIDTDIVEQKWKDIIEMMEGFNLAGNRMINPDIPIAFFLSPKRLLEQTQSNSVFTFTSDQLDLSYRNVLLPWIEVEHEGMELDVVSYPLFSSGQSEQRPVRVKEVLAINEHGLNKQEAYQVIEFMVSPEFQIRNAQKGLGPVTVTEEVVTRFGENVVQLRNKNLGAFFMNQPSIQPYMEMRQYPEITQNLWGISEQLEMLYRREISGQEALEAVLGHYKMIIQ